MTKEKTIIDRERDSGSVTWNHSEIVWEKANGSTVTINLDDVLVIGEYTTDAGPFFDDWFLVFVYKTGDWDSISIYANGIDTLQQFLSQKYNADFYKYLLANSTEWQSYVRYPNDLEGQRLFVIAPPPGYKSPMTLIRKFQSVLGLGKYGRSWNFELTKEVESKLKNDGA